MLGSVLLIAACAAKRSPVVAPTSGGPIVALLADADGSVGRLIVENAAGSVELVDARAATRIRDRQSPAAVSILTEDDVQRLFGDALSALPPAPQRFVLNFRFESDELTDESRKMFPRILTLVRERTAADVVVTGHTDTMGASEANFTLGMKRARAVRALLVKAGLDPDRVAASSLGESDPLVRTGDNTAEPRNRRVDIAVR